MYSAVRKGFSLIELVIVVAIIAIAMSIAVPSAMQMRASGQRTVCINNMRKITGAIEEWSLENNIPNGASIAQEQEEEICGTYLRGGKPKCPSGGTYTFHPVGSNPQVECSREGDGHKL